MERLVHRVIEMKEGVHRAPSLNDGEIATKQISFAFLFRAPARKVAAHPIPVLHLHREMSRCHVQNLSLLLVGQPANQLSLRRDESTLALAVDPGYELLRGSLRNFANIVKCTAMGSSLGPAEHTLK